MTDLDAIACPFCPTGAGRPPTFSIVDLVAHVLDRHPGEMISAGREILRGQVVERTEVVLRPTQHEEAAHGA